MQQSTAGSGIYISSHGLRGDILTIIKWLQEQGYRVSDVMQTHIADWYSWYVGDVKGFHNYRVYNGRSHIDCRRKSLNMAKQVCQDWADLLLNERVHINHPNKATQDFLVGVLDDNDFWIRGNQAVEDAFWSGLVACVPCPVGVATNRDGVITGADKIRLSFSVGNQIIPLTVDNGMCTECAFKSDTKIGDTVYTTLQMCVKEGGLYVMYNKLFDTTSGACNEVNPATVKGFEHLVSKWETGLDIPPYAFIKPNLKNSIDPQSPFGMSVYAGALDILRGLDTVYDAYVNEYLLGKTRVMVQAEAVNFESGRPVFDPDDIVFYSLPAAGRADEKPMLQAVQPTIRAEQMQQGLDDNLKLLSLRCGFGERHYNFANDNVTTATQVISEHSHMFRVLKKHEIVLDSFFKRLAQILIFYGKYYLKQPLKEGDITVDFDDSIIEDKTAINNDMRLDVSAGILKPEIYLSKKYNVTVDEARQMLPDAEPEYVYAGGGAE